MDEAEAGDEVGDLNDNTAQQEGFTKMAGAENVNIPGMYLEEDYANLPVDQETKELFKYITR